MSLICNTVSAHIQNFVVCVSVLLVADTPVGSNFGLTASERVVSRNCNGQKVNKQANFWLLSLDSVIVVIVNVAVAVAISA